jgi:hypothetical protein
MAPASLLRLALDRVDWCRDGLPQHVLDLHMTHNVEPHQNRMKHSLQEAFYNNHPILHLRSLAEVLWVNELSGSVATIDEGNAWTVIQDVVSSHGMAASLNPTEKDLVSRAIQFQAPSNP